MKMDLYVFTEGSVCVYRCICMCSQRDLYVCTEGSVCVYRWICMCVGHEPHKDSCDWQDWGLTLEALPPRGRGSAECPKKDKRRTKTHRTQQIDLNKWKLGWTLSLPQTSRANPVQCCSTHQKKNASVCAYRCICMCSLKKTLFWRDMSFEGIYICVPSQRAFFEGMSFEETYVQCTCVL